MLADRTTTDPVLLNPRQRAPRHPDERSEEIMRSLLAFFEGKGKEKLKADDRASVWYADFLEHQRANRLFATMCTPAGYGAPDSRWDTSRICEWAEILGFYGLHYWYVWQVSVLGLGPIWMSDNEAAKQRAAELLEEGGIFAFGLSEREHGADLYSTEMTLHPNGDGTYRARGSKYYIGNGNQAAMVSTFGKLADTGEYVFFVVDSAHENYECVRSVVNVQSYVSEFRLHDYPITEAEILSRGDDAWNAALNTVNIGKYNLGWASVGIATHAFYEALNHAHGRVLYGMKVTDFPHARRLFSDAYARLVAMKLVARRACDYMRSASAEDRRYLLFNPVVKMKVTTEGERVVDHVWDVIAAKGFETDMYFEMATRDIRALPKLEGTVHVNIALIVKFMAAYLFDPRDDLPEIGRRSDAGNDAFLFNQGPARGLTRIRFHNHDAVFAAWAHLPNVAVFREQIAALKVTLSQATPSEEHQRDTDFLLALGELFCLVVYGQLALEGAELEGIDEDVVNEIFGVFVRDFSRYAIELHGKASTTPQQAEHCLRMVHRAAVEAERSDRVWTERVLALAGAYEMSP